MIEREFIDYSGVLGPYGTGFCNRVISGVDCFGVLFTKISRRATGGGLAFEDRLPAGLIETKSEEESREYFDRWSYKVGKLSGLCFGGTLQVLFFGMPAAVWFLVFDRAGIQKKIKAK
jgi:hypothetical protein